MPGFSAVNNRPIVRNLAYMYMCVCVCFAMTPVFWKSLGTDDIYERCPEGIIRMIHSWNQFYPLGMPAAPSSQPNILEIPSRTNLLPAWGQKGMF